MARCEICNSELGELPMGFGSSSPALMMVPELEYGERVLENADQCIVDDKYYFVRGHIEIPVLNAKEPFVWSVWVSLSKDSFDSMSELWETEGREKSEPYFGWLMTVLPCYPDTLHLETSVQIQPVGQVPLITLEPSDHPLSLEQHNGIAFKRVHEIIHEVMGH